MSHPFRRRAIHACIICVGASVGLAACATHPTATTRNPVNPRVEAHPSATLLTESPVLSSNIPIITDPAAARNSPSSFPSLPHTDLTAQTVPANVDPANKLLQQLLPQAIKDRNGWRTDILNAFTALHIPSEAPYFCAALSVIEQESGWQSDPVVPNLDRIVWKEVGKRAGKYHVPLPVVKAALLKPSPNGRSYKSRIDALRTETEMNALFEDMVADARKLGLPVTMKNPIRTGGPMQVSVEFAEGQVKAWPYPYRLSGTIRSEVFTRRGGVYFGIADLLQYRADYPDMIYRFADYNAGRYSSRNAAFQAALGRLSHKKIVLDGDLLNYDSAAPSMTRQRVLGLSARLGMTAAAIERDLRLEKTGAFARSPLYVKVFELADMQSGSRAPRELLPQIRLDSPKITRKLTTEWFAKRVDGRYAQCMARRQDR